MTFNDEGGGVISQKLICDYKGGTGVQTPPKKHGIINKQPLNLVMFPVNFLHSIYFLRVLKILAMDDVKTLEDEFTSLM